MNVFRTLILAGAVALGANAALANESARTDDTARIQQGIYAAQNGGAGRSAVVREGRSATVGAAPVRDNSAAPVRDPFYFQQASSGSDRNAN